MRLVPVLRDPELREPAGAPVRLDAVLPRPPERREATRLRGLSPRTEGPAGLDPLPDHAGDLDARPAWSRRSRRAPDLRGASPSLSGRLNALSPPPPAGFTLCFGKAPLSHAEFE